MSGLILIVVVIVLFLLAKNFVFRRELDFWRDAMHQQDRPLGGPRPHEIDWPAEEPSRPSRVENTDWALALGLNTTSWRVTDPDDDTDSFVTDDIGIAVDSLIWGCTVETVEQQERLEPWLRL